MASNEETPPNSPPKEKAPDVGAKNSSDEMEEDEKSGREVSALAKEEAAENAPTAASTPVASAPLFGVTPAAAVSTAPATPTAASGGLFTPAAPTASSTHATSAPLFGVTPAAAVSTAPATPTSASGGLFAPAAEFYELEKINGHVIVLDKEVQFHGTWKYWPDACSQLFTYEALKDSAYELLEEYLKNYGIAKDPQLTEEEFQKIMVEKMTPSKMAFPPVPKSGIKLTNVLSHTVDNDGNFVFKTKWNNGDIIDRPEEAFTKGQIKVLNKYLGKHNLPLKPTEAKRKPVEAKRKPSSSLDQGTRSRPKVARSISPQPSTSAIKKEDDDNDDEGSAASLVIDDGEQMTTPKLKQKPFKMRLISHSHQKTVTKRITKKKKTAPKASTKASTSGQQCLTPNTSGTRRRPRNTTAKKVVSFFKTSQGDEMMVVEDADGQLSLRNVDEELKKDAQFVIEALKDKAFTQMGRA